MNVTIEARVEHYLAMEYTSAERYGDDDSWTDRIVIHLPDDYAPPSEVLAGFGPDGEIRIAYRDTDGRNIAAEYHDASFHPMEWWWESAVANRNISLEAVLAWAVSENWRPSR